MNRILARVGVGLAALLVLALAGLAVARVLFVRYLHSEAFRQSLGEGAANALHANHADFAPLAFDGDTVYGDNFQARRDDGGGFSTLDADQLRATLDWHGLLRHRVQIDELTVQRLDIAPPVMGDAMPLRPGSGLPPPAPFGQVHPGWKVDLRKAVINEANWHWAEEPLGGITGAALTLIPDEPGAWTIEAQGGTVQTSGLPSLDLETASLRWQNPILYINSATLRDGPGGLAVTGSIETRKNVNLHVKLDGIDVQPLLAPDWRERLSGRLDGNLTIDAPLGISDAAGQVTVSGSLSLTDGQLTALPILDQIGAFTRTERFRQLELTRATADFTRTPARLDVRNLMVESEGLIRVEGSYSVVNGQIDGDFQVGLTPETLQWIPGSQEQIFIASRDGYRWTPVKLTGPVDHPLDDLTPRLVAATGNTLLKGAEGVEDTVRKAGQGVLNLLLH